MAWHREDTKPLPESLVIQANCAYLSPSDWLSWLLHRIGKIYPYGEKRHCLSTHLHPHSLMVVGRSLIGCKAPQVSRKSQVYHGGQAVVVVLGPEFMSIDLRMACEGRELASQSWCSRKSLLLPGQLYTFCLLVCQLLPEIDVNTSLRSDDKSLTTAHEYKKFRIFELVNRS